MQEGKLLYCEALSFSRVYEFWDMYIHLLTSLIIHSQALKENRGCIVLLVTDYGTFFSAHGISVFKNKYMHKIKYKGEHEHNS